MLQKHLKYQTFYLVNNILIVINKNIKFKEIFYENVIIKIIK